jgi:hypothetical protein
MGNIPLCPLPTFLLPPRLLPFLSLNPMHTPFPPTLHLQTDSSPHPAPMMLRFIPYGAALLVFLAAGGVQVVASIVMKMMIIIIIIVILIT